MADQGQPRITSPFLEIPSTHHIDSNGLAFAIHDKYPVSPGHTLVVPRRVVAQWWDATAEEQQAILALVDHIRADLLDDETPDRVCCPVCHAQTVSTSASTPGKLPGRPSITYTCT